MRTKAALERSIMAQRIEKKTSTENRASGTTISSLHVPLLYRAHRQDGGTPLHRAAREGFEDVMEQGGAVQSMACGSDFILTTNSAGNVYAKGANKFG